MLRAPITPLKLPRGVRTVVVLGGMFDPPHEVHTGVPRAVVSRLYARTGWLLFVPAAASPHKSDGPHAPDDHRLAMLRLALGGASAIWTDEIDRGGPSYTVETLRRLRRVVPARVRLRLMIGADQVAHFHRWKSPREIIRLAEPLVLAREPWITASAVWSALDRGFWTRGEKASWCTRLAPNFPLPAASTLVRRAIPDAPADPAQWSRAEPLSFVSPRVARYIIRHRLYGFRGGARPGTDDRRYLREVLAGAARLRS